MAIDKIANLISNMTIYLMQNTDKGDIRVKNGLSSKIDISPCTNMTRKQWMSFIVRTLLLEGDGNAVVLPTYEDDDGDGYTIQIGNRKYNPEDLIHFVLNPSMENPYKGVGYRIPIKNLVETLAAGEEAKQDFMGNQYLPRIIVAVNGDPEEITSAEGQEELNKKFIDSAGKAKPWFIPQDVMKIEQVKPLTLKDIAVTDSVAQDKKTLAGLLGVPAFLLGEGTFNREEYNTFIKDKIMSIAKVIEQTLTQSLLLSPNLYFKFNIRSLYSYDLDLLASVGGELFDRGIMTGNEVRDWISLSPKEGLDELKILENYIPAEDSGNQKKLEGGNNENNEEA